MNMRSSGLMTHSLRSVIVRLGEVEVRDRGATVGGLGIENWVELCAREKLAARPKRSRV